MNEKEKYHFVPAPNRARSLDNGTYSVSIGKIGSLHIGNQTAKKYFNPAKFLKIYFDQDQRTVALFPTDTLTQGDKNARTLTLRKDGGFTLSINSILKALLVFGQSFSGLELKEYVDKTYGKLLVFKIPKQ